MAKLPAIQFYPGDWKKSRWVSYNIDDLPEWLSIASLPGCYVVYVDSKLVYIGQSMNVSKRVKNHEINFARYSSLIQTPWGQFKSLKLKVHYSVKYGDWAMRELRLIKKLNPKFNKVGACK